MPPTRADMGAGLVSIALALSLAANATRPATNPCVKRAGRLIARNDFARVRDLDEYQNTFGDPFLKALKALRKKGAGGHWIDAGAGQAIALTDFLKGIAQVDERPLATAISYKMSRGRAKLKTFGDRFKTITDKFIEDLPDRAVASADLITDLYGPILYSARPDLVMTKYLTWLKPDGRILMTMGQTSEGGLNSLVIGNDGKPMPLIDWLKTIRGIRVKVTESVLDFDVKVTNVEIARIGDKPFEIPELEPVGTTHDTPPMRILRLAKAKGAPAPIAAKGYLPDPPSDEEIKRMPNGYRPGTISQYHFLFGSRPFEDKDSPFRKRVESLNSNELWFDLSKAPRPALRTKKNQPQVGDFAALAGMPEQSLRFFTDADADIFRSTNPGEKLRLLAEKLKRGGEAYLSLGGDFIRETWVTTRSGDVVKLEDWLKSQPGLDVKIDHTYGTVISRSSLYARIRIRDPKTVRRLPGLKLIGGGGPHESIVLQEE